MQPPLPLTLTESAMCAVGLTPSETGLTAQVKTYGAAMLTLLERNGSRHACAEAIPLVQAACVRAADALQRRVIPIQPVCCGKCHERPAVDVKHPPVDDTEGGATD